MGAHPVLAPPTMHLVLVLGSRSFLVSVSAARTSSVLVSERCVLKVMVFWSAAASAPCGEHGTHGYSLRAALVARESSFLRRRYAADVHRLATRHIACRRGPASPRGTTRARVPFTLLTIPARPLLGNYVPAQSGPFTLGELVRS